MRQILNEIKSFTEILIEHGMSISQNFPAIVGSTVTWGNQKDISIALKNLDYENIYAELDQTKNYNIKMLDGALIQMMYRFSNNGRELISHRLAFFPSPRVERYDDNPSAYEELYFGECVYHDIVSKYVVSFPLRFDYDSDHNKHVNLSHPKAHLHLGQYEHCRVPVCAPITPALFMHFLLRNFYFNAFIRMSIADHYNRFERCISSDEQSLIHVNF